MTYTPALTRARRRAIRDAIRSGDGLAMLEQAGLLIDELDAIAALSEDREDEGLFEEGGDLEDVSEDEGGACEDEGFECDREPDGCDEGDAQAPCYATNDPTHPWPPQADFWSNGR